MDVVGQDNSPAKHLGKDNTSYLGPVTHLSFSSRSAASISKRGLFTSIISPDAVIQTDTGMSAVTVQVVDPATRLSRE